MTTAKIPHRENHYALGFTVHGTRFKASRRP